MHTLGIGKMKWNEEWGDVWVEGSIDMDHKNLFIVLYCSIWHTGYISESKQHSFVHMRI